MSSYVSKCEKMRINVKSSSKWFLKSGFHVSIWHSNLTNINPNILYSVDLLAIQIYGIKFEHFLVEVSTSIGLLIQTVNGKALADFFRFTTKHKQHLL